MVSSFGGRNRCKRVVAFVLIEKHILVPCDHFTLCHQCANSCHRRQNACPIAKVQFLWSARLPVDLGLLHSALTSFRSENTLLMAEVILQMRNLMR